MKILVIEDEIKTAKALIKLISTIDPDAEIVASLQTVSAAIEYLSASPSPDLIFMDIQLADGSCFDIFKEATVTAPVIFCTAYDEYAIEAFKANGIDYILKPFTEETLAAAFKKVAGLRRSLAQQEVKPVYPLPLQQGKKSFLVFRDNKYVVIAVDNISFFYIKNDFPALVTFDGKEYTLSQSLDTISAQLPPEQFYRINRQYLINFSAVHEVEHYFGRKLLVHLKTATPEKIIIGKNKATEFLHWLDNR
ncbi:two component transcriptional regulator, LytTR family [Chitinophaga sp. YR627]|uniref:LytR/AlgR family response regulator transcription factor n=1 Tax=Chitinophaga sp. YR627 TaxID=1881041 RepID=UPI0008EBFCAE|nr:LytTR family DNA-binding domain-containing protein [Chitinophaga sp. YR627]SFO21943.1 two component transcriptional regulator, LytTR family [Chitinophaga sp. YR627]